MNRRNRQDILVYALLIMLGALAVALSCRAKDFVGDAYYFELARSIVKGSGYVFDFRPQTMVPPGFPYLLALIIAVVGSSYTVLVRSMAVFFTIGLIGSYELLRREEGRPVAAAACLLLGSSPEVFQFSTKMVFSDMPYFATSMMLLWLIVWLDSSQMRLARRTIGWLLAAVLMIVSVLMRSTGIALATGILGWLVISLIRSGKTSKRRIRIFLPLAIAGLAVQGIWMQWATRHQYSEWPVHGYQENYIAQLKLKNGNDPEMGMANWQDILLRPIQNEDDQAGALLGLLTRKQMAAAWYSPGTLVPLALLLLGLGASFWRNGGGPLEWYFVSYETLFLFWPWNFELRFLLPVVPLACLYMWRGGVVLWQWAHAKSRDLGTAVLIVTAGGIGSSLVWGRHVEHPSMRSCIAIWAFVAGVAMVLLYGGRIPAWETSLLRGRKPGRILAATLLGGIVLAGVAMQVRIGLQNYYFDLKADGSYPDIEAAEWIRTHSSPSAVVMARKQDLVFHYSRHKVIWFPPSSDPKVLMHGIRQYHVRYVVVVDGDSYWTPASDVCFKALSRAYPGEFQIVHQGPHDEVFLVDEPAAPSKS